MDAPTQQQQAPRTSSGAGFLGETAALWVALGLAQNGGAVLEITPEQWEHAKKKLAETGHDVGRDQEQARLVVLDAHRVHAELTADGSARPERFDRIIETSVARIREAIPDGPIHVWTHTVNLLEAHHGPWMAEFVRSLWKQAAAEHSLAILGPSSIPGDQDAFGSGDGNAEDWCEYVSVSTMDPWIEDR